MIMTVEEVKERVALIAAAMSDDEAAHAMEDRLRTDVLKAIVDGHETPALLAAAGALN